MGSLALALGVALAAAFASIVVGRNLTRSIAAGAISIGALAFALIGSGAGFVGFFVVTVAALVLATIQLFGWMLVDVDRDHLPPTDRATSIARSLAFLLLGGGLVLLVATALDRGVFTPIGGSVMLATASQIGELLFGPWRDLATLSGIAIAASMLASLMLLRGDEQGR